MTPALDIRMTRKYVYYLLAATLLIVVGLVYALSRGEVITVRADENLLIRRDPVEPPVGNNVLSTIAINETVEVVECEDLKSDVVIRVRISSGEIGYVSAGRYSLERNPATIEWVFRSPSRITFSCRGMFRNRTSAGKVAGKG